MAFKHVIRDVTPTVPAAGGTVYAYNAQGVPMEVYGLTIAEWAALFTILYTIGMVTFSAPRWAACGKCLHKGRTFVCPQSCDKYRR